MAKQNNIFSKIRKGSQTEKLAKILLERRDDKSVKKMKTVGDLVGYRMGLRLSCTKCGASEDLSGDRLIARYGETTALSEIGPEKCACAEGALDRMPFGPV